MITILLSTYNGERFLRQQLDSIIAQTVTDWRLFIRDDGSTDGTVAVLQEYAEAHPNRIFLDETDRNRLGACRSFEYLLAQHGDAEYIAFADQDDIWLPDKLALCLKQMKQQETLHPNQPIVVHSDLRVVDETLQEIAPSFWRYSNIRPDLTDRNLCFMAISNSVTGCAMLFNRAARAAALPFATTGYMHDAWIALQTLAHGGQVCPHCEPTVLYRQHGENSLGAVRFSLFGKTLRKRISDAQRCYAMAHPMVFRNKAHFLLLKTTYHIRRLLSAPAYE